MTKGDIILRIVLLLFSAGLFLLGFLQFKEKGLLLNNAYLYASRREREKMDKKPYFRQSAIVFFLLGFVFLLIFVGEATGIRWLNYLSILVIVALLAYAIVSTVKIEKNKRR